MMVSAVHAQKLLKEIGRYQHDGYLCDTVIVTDDGQLLAHSVVLTAASPVFKAALNDNKKPREHIIVIPGVKLSLMKTLLQFIYTGEIVPVPKDMSAVMSLMLELQLVALQHTDGSVANQKTVESCADNHLVGLLSPATSTSEACSLDAPHVKISDSGTPDTEQTIASDRVSVASVPAEIKVNIGTDNRTESSNSVSFQTVADVTADDDMFRVRRRRSSGPVQKICEVCGKGFRHHETFRSHQRKHARPPNQKVRPRPNLRLMCQVCGLRSKNAVAFARHMRMYHPSALGIENTGAPFQCRECEERFFSEQVLRHHARLVHVRNPPRKKTSWFHRQQRPRGSGLPVCSYCGRCCTTRPALEAHELVHTNMKPHTCCECGRCFRQLVHLTVHLRTHSNERPFTCRECKKAYKNRVDLRKHCARKHGITLAMRRQRGTAGVDLVAEAVAAANIGPDDGDEIHCH